MSVATLCLRPQIAEEDEQHLGVGADEAVAVEQRSGLQIGWFVHKKQVCRELQVPPGRHNAPFQIF